MSSASAPSRRAHRVGEFTEWASAASGRAQRAGERSEQADTTETVLEHTNSRLTLHTPLQTPRTRVVWQRPQSTGPALVDASVPQTFYRSN